MGILTNVQLSCFLFSYVIALILEGMLLAKRTTVLRWLVVLFGCIGLLTHTAYLVIRSQQVELPPLLASSHDWFLVLAWLVAALFVALSFLQERWTMGLFLLPIVLALVATAVFIDESPQSVVKTVAVYRWGMLHAASLVLGTASVLSALVAALMYLLQHRHLRNPRQKTSLRLPTLESLADVNWWSVIFAVPMLTIGTATGIILMQLSANDARRITFFDPVVLGTLGVWIGMAGLFAWMIRRRERSGRHVAQLTIMAGGFLLATLIGLTILSGGHSQESAAESAEAPEKDSAFHRDSRDHGVSFSVRHHPHSSQSPFPRFSQLIDS